jgi:orotate phosphoribosyltransferase
VVEDVITSGKSIREGGIDIARALALDVVAAATLCNRGKTSADLSISGPIHSLLDIAWPSWAATEAEPCRPCVERIPFDTEVGHAQEYLDGLAKENLLEPWMQGS